MLRLILSVIPFTVLFPVLLEAHDSLSSSARWYIGPWGTYEYGYPTSIDRAFGVLPLFGTSGKGVSWDNSGALNARIFMPDVFTTNYGLIVSAGYRKGSGIFKSTAFSSTPTFRDGSPDTVLSSEHFRVISEYEMPELQALATYSLSKHWYAGAGIFTNFRFGTIVDRIEIFSPADTRYANGQPYDTVDLSVDPGTSRFHYGLPFAIGTRIPITDILSLGIEAFAKLDLGEAFRGYMVQSLSAGIGLGMLFDLSPKPEAPLPAEEKLQKPFFASIQLKVNGVDEEKVAVETFDTTETRYIALPARIGYEQNRTGIPTLFRLHSSAPTTITLDRASAQQTYSELLNIIGMRMRDKIGEELRVTSLYSYSESPTIASQRASAITSYLKQTWGIAKHRLIEQTARDSSAAAVLSGDPALLSPYISTWTERTFSVPDITVDKYISSSENIHWQVIVREGTSIRLSYAKNDIGEKTSQQGLALTTLENGKDPLIAELIVRDASGKVQTSYDTLRVRLDRTDGVQASVRRETFILSADSLATSTSWSSILLDRALRAITAQSIVRVVPLSSQEAMHRVGAIMLDRMQKMAVTAKRFEVLQPVQEQTPAYLEDMVEIRIIRP